VTAEGVVHIAGLVCQVGSVVRQRCGWCGAMLSDYDLELTAVAIPDPRPEGWHWEPPMWELGCLVWQLGAGSRVVEAGPDGKLPPGACAGLDPSITA
jgi:hypothetical protein